MPAPSTARICPNCQAAVPAGRRQCLVCKLEVAKMDAFAAAKQAARRRGLKTTKVQEAKLSLWQRPGAIGLTFLLLIIGGFIAYYMTRPTPPPWTKFPTSQEALVNQLFQDIAVGNDTGYDKAYALISPSVKDANNGDELANYEQSFTECFKYLNLFDDTWAQDMKIDRDPDNPNQMLVHVGPETLHVGIHLETPADKVNDTNKHYAATGIGEFDVSYAQAEASNEARRALIGNFAGQGALHNLDAITGAGSYAHESPTRMKIRLMPLLLDPRHVNNYEIYHTWKIRKDPAVRWVLERIANDGRYASDAQSIAKEVLTDRVSEEELIAAGVEN